MSTARPGTCLSCRTRACVSTSSRPCKTKSRNCSAVPRKGTLTFLLSRARERENPKRMRHGQSCEKIETTKMSLPWFQNSFPLYLAPMAGVSDKIFRQLCNEHGADVLTTEFVSAE